MRRARLTTLGRGLPQTVQRANVPFGAARLMPLVLPGQEASLNEPGRIFPRHHHLRGYAALLIEGSCEEAGDCGRFRLGPGDVLLHRPFEAHQDRIGPQGARFINFALPEGSSAMFGHVLDLDAIMRAHERDPREAATMLLDQIRPFPGPPEDWPDRLARMLRRPKRMRLDEWAEHHSLNPASLSRGFQRSYGVTPKRYRLEQLASRAARRMRESCEPLSAVASECGFADQAHMTRAFRLLFGVTPRMLRALR